MRHTSLLSPGTLANAGRLRSEVAMAISRVQLTGLRTPGGKTAQARQLRNFLVDAAARLDVFVESTVPTVLSRVRTNATTITITFSETLAAGTNNTPAPSAFTVTGGTVQSVAVSGSTVVLTGTGFDVGDTVAYTQPAEKRLRDLGGNLVANFSGAVA